MARKNALKAYRVTVKVPGLPAYGTVVMARSHIHARELTPNGMGGKVSTVLLKPPAHMAR